MCCGSPEGPEHLRSAHPVTSATTPGEREQTAFGILCLRRRRSSLPILELLPFPNTYNTVLEILVLKRLALRSLEVRVGAVVHYLRM